MESSPARLRFLSSAHKGILNPSDFLSRHPNQSEVEEPEKTAEDYVNFLIMNAVPKPYLYQRFSKQLKLTTLTLCNVSLRWFGQISGRLATAGAHWKEWIQQNNSYSAKSKMNWQWAKRQTSYSVAIFVELSSHSSLYNRLYPIWTVVNRKIKIKLPQIMIPWGSDVNLAVQKNDEQAKERKRWEIESFGHPCGVYHVDSSEKEKQMVNQIWSTAISGCEMQRNDDNGISTVMSLTLRRLFLLWRNRIR